MTRWAKETFGKVVESEVSHRRSSDPPLMWSEVVRYSSLVQEISDPAELGPRSVGRQSHTWSMGSKEGNGLCQISV